MWKPAVSNALVGALLVYAASAGAAQDNVTYWQDDACTRIDLGGGMGIDWCVEAVEIGETKQMELRVSWRSLGLGRNVLEKGSDRGNRKMYLTDESGHRYDHVETRGSAERGGTLDDRRPRLRGVFVFPPARSGATELTFHDEENGVSIDGIRLSSEARTDPVTSASVLGLVMGADVIRIDYSWSGLGRQVQEQYVLHAEEGGFRVEGVRDGTVAVELPVQHVPTAEIESFLETLALSPLLEREYQPLITHTDDYPSIAVELQTGEETVTFFTRSQGEHHVPWGVASDGKEYVIPDDTPARALRALDAFLGRDPASRATAWLAPKIGEEAAASLWEKLENGLGSEEGLRIAFGLKDTLGGEGDDEILSALDDYLEERAAAEREPVASQRLPNGDTALVDAARRGDTATLAALLSQNVDANERSELDGQTALLAAAANDHPEAVQVLLAAGADPAFPSLSGETALTLAASFNHVETVTALLAAGASADVKGRDGKTPLMQAAERGHTPMVEALLAAGADANVRSLRGDTALSLAASNDRVAAVRRLLRAGANPNFRDSYGVNALMKTTNPNVASALIRAGANVNAVDDSGRTAIMRLAGAGLTRASMGGRGSASSRAATLRELLSAGADVRARDMDGKTALIWATTGVTGHESYPELLPVLIEAGAELDATDRRGSTALLYAVVNGHTDSVRILIDAGANVNVRMGNLPAVALAIQSGYSEIAQLLIRAGARR